MINVLIILSYNDYEETNDLFDNDFIELVRHILISIMGTFVEGQEESGISPIIN
jgi:hypothetical protein